jgi:uncharacterized protein YdaU (DUF1376 family)
MNYYEHHIGDYAQATMHLSFVEDAAYCRLIRKYYATERPLTGDLKQLQRLVGARTKEEKIAVDTILEEFFYFDDGVWRNKRCDEEIAKYLDGEPEREVKKANETNRLKRHRDERASLFKRLTDAGHHAAWNIGMSELRDLVKRHCDQTETDLPPLPETAPATPATATQTPDTRHQTPDVNLTPPPGGEAAKPPMPKRGAQLSPDFYPNETGIAYAETKRVAIAIELESFRNWHSAKGSTMKDWQAAWRTWCDKVVEFGRANGARASPNRPETLHDKRARAMEELTGRRSGGHERTERDITGECSAIPGEAIRVAG